MIILLDAAKTFHKIQHCFTMKDVERLGIQWKYLNIIKAVYNKLLANINVNGENLEAIPQITRTRQGSPFPQYGVNVVLEVLA